MNHINTMSEVSTIHTADNKQTFLNVWQDREDLIINIAKKYAGEDYEDLVQDVFEKLWRIVDRLTIDIRFPAFIKQVIKNQYIDGSRKKKNIQMTADIPEILDRNQMPDQAFLVKETLEIYQKIPNHLRIPLDYRIAGYKTKDIAQHIDAGMNTTLGRIRYARLHLKKILEEEQKIIYPIEASILFALHDMVCEITDVTDEASWSLLGESLKYYFARELITRYHDASIYEEIQTLFVETSYNMRRKIIMILSSKKHDIFIQLSKLAKKKQLGEKLRASLG